MLLLAWSGQVMAQNELLARFAGVYTVEYGPQDVRFVIYPQGPKLGGNIVFGGRDHKLTVTVDGLTMKAVFGQDEQRQYFRMPLSSGNQAEVTFADIGHESWIFLRHPLPEFAGEFRGHFGRITLTESGTGSASGQYSPSGSNESVEVSVVPRGLEAILEGPVDGKIFYSIEEQRYFAQVNGHFSAASYKSPELLAQERRVRERRDHYAWDRALAKRTEAALESYRRDWPDGLHVDEIPAAIEELHWEDVLADGRFRDFVRHAKRYPEGRFAGKADDAAWHLSRKHNSDKSYNSYLKAFPTGNHVESANAGKEALAWRRASHEQSIKGYGKFRQALS